MPMSERSSPTTPPQVHDEGYAAPPAGGQASAAVAKFRALHHGDQPLLLPNAWDFASAAVLVEAGFPAVGTTSLGVSAAHGLRDGRGQGRDETLALALRLARLPVPITVDLERGFSDEPGEVAELAGELAAAGIAGVNLEDGLIDGGLADPRHQATVIRAVKGVAPDLFVNARTDTHWLCDGADLDRTVARLRAYADAGADGVFVPGLADEHDIAAVAAAIPLPLNVLFSPAGPGLRRLSDLGVRRVSTGSLLFRSALHAVGLTARAVRDGGTLPTGIPSYAAVDTMVGEAATGPA